MGHNLSGLFQEVKKVAGKFDIKNYGEMPDSQIHKDIITILSDFASNVTRYYNLDIIARNKTTGNNEPISQWYKKVIIPLFTNHVSKQKKEKIINDASLVSFMMDRISVVAHINEAGEPMNNMLQASYQTGLLEATAPYARLYVLQICRFLAAVLSEQGHIAMERQISNVPYMSDFFRVFYNKDSYLKKTKTWEIV